MRETPTNTPIIHSVFKLCMVAPTCFGITLTSWGSVPSAFWEMFNSGAVGRILWMGVLCAVAWSHPQYCINCSSIEHLSEGIPWLHYPRERPGTHCIGGWVVPSACLDGWWKSRPYRNSTSDPPARSESLYQLSYLDPLCTLYIYI
jgi:hypothetical protein